MIENFLTRIHKSLAKEPFRLEVFNDDEKLAKEFIFWLCFNLDRDIWNFVKIDLKKFAKDLGYSTKTHFSEIIKNPQQLAGYTPEEIQEMRDQDIWIYETRFENMLYKLQTFQVDLYQKDETLKTDFKYSLKSFKLIDQVDIYVDKKNRSKKYYSVKPTEDFFKLLSESYLMFQFEKFIQLSRKSKKIKLEDVYLYLCTLKNDSKVKKTTDQWLPVEFDILCDKAGISHYKKQARKKIKLKEILDDIITTDPQLNLDYRFDFYKPMLFFEKNTPQKVDEIKKMKVFHFERMIKYYFFTTYFEKAVQKEGKTKELFMKWFEDPTKEVNIKRDAYMKAHKIYWNKPIPKDHPAIDFFIRYQKMYDS